ncbi:MAG: ATP-binding protein [Oscillospiraceae bacterium]|nr:ATP-binding protein [Oscillospiraceae bacterium]
MLCQFTVKNFRCFRDEATLDMQATSITENENTLITDIDGEKYLPLAVIYGPNGAGKSTVLSALYSLLIKIMRPVCALTCDNFECSDKSFCSNQSINIPIEPFAFDKVSKNLPTEYELFFRTDLKEYQYQISIKKSKIVNEALYHKKKLSSRYTNVFVREGKNIELRGSLKNYDTSALSDNLPLLSYLIITHSRNATIKDIFKWLESKIDFRNYGVPRTEAEVALDDNAKPLVLNMLKEMDIDIDDYRIVSGDNEDDGSIEVYTSHIVDGNRTELSLLEESNGTIKIFGLLPYLARSILNGTTLLIDELDAKLHPFLLEYIISLYNNPSINKNGAQLIFTSHDLTTMNSDCFRRDEVWYVAKNNQGAAKLYSLVEFARKDAKYDKQYIEGKYGACPYLKRIINWEVAG